MSGAALNHYRAARIISTILLPPFTLFAAYVTAVRNCHTLAIAPSVLIGIAFSLIVLFPILYFLYLMKLKKISDQDAMDRHERSNPYIFGICLMSVGLLVSLICKLPGMLAACWLSFLLSLVVVLLVNYFWKISAHLMSFSVAAFAVCNVAGYKYAWLFLFAFFLGWSRMYIKSHTLAQVVAGFCCGGLISVISFFIFT